MKNTLASSCLFLALILAAVCAALATRKSVLEKRVASLEIVLRENEIAEQTSRARVEKLTRQKDAFKKRAEMLAAELKTNRLTLTAIAAASLSANKENPRVTLNAPPVKPPSDPEARKAMRQEHEDLLNIAYAPLLKLLGLDAATSDQLHALLLDQQIKATDHAAALLLSNPDKAGQAAALKEISEDQAALAEKVKALLGPARYAQFQEYNQTIGERIEVDQFSQQFAAGQTPLTDAQSQQLLDIMSAEQRGMPALSVPGDPTGILDASTLQTLSDGRLNELFAAMEESDQRVLQRAADVLTANQLQALANLLSAQLQAQSASIIAARALTLQQARAATVP
jgi:hypothetical protein